MLELTPEHIRDFRLCRYLFNAKHNEGRVEHSYRSDRDQLKNKLEDDLNALISFLYFERMGNHNVSASTLTNRWNKIWFGDMKVDDIKSERTSPGRNIHHYNTDALEMIHRFYEQRKNDEDTVLMLSEPYSLPVTETSFASGFIKLALRKEGVPYLEYFTTKTQKAFGNGTERWYGTILDSLAFASKANEVPVIRVNYLKTGKYQDSMVSDLEFRQVRELADEIERCTSFPPATETYWCDKCKFKKECNKW